jgi:hypothetical protein
MNPAASARSRFSFEPTRTGREPTFSRVSVRLNETNSAPLDTGKTANYGGAMADRQDTSRVLSQGIDSTQEGANRPKTIGWVSWKISSTRSLADGVSWSSLAGGALRSARAGGRRPFG